MIYFIQQIALYMLGAYIIGAIYGWFMRAIRSEHDQARIERQYEHELKVVQTENQQLRAQLDSLQSRIEELEERPPSGVQDDWANTYPLDVIREIEPAALKKLNQLGIHSTRDLCKRVVTEEDVFELARQAKVEDFSIQRWTSIAQLLRVGNIDIAYAELLEETQIYSLEDLAQQKPVRLLEKMAKTNERIGANIALPNESDTAAWIEHARHLLGLTGKQ